MLGLMGVRIYKRSNKVKMLFLIKIVSLAFFPHFLFAKNQLDQAVLNEYLKSQKEFSDSVCRPGVEETYQKLDLNYRGDGNHIPTLLDNKIDQKTIKASLPLIKEKVAWINEQLKKLEKNNFKEGLEILKRIENEVELLQKAKKDHFFATTKKKKKIIQTLSQKQFIQLLKEVEALKNAIPFLLSFNFPLDHLDLRVEYEKYKEAATKEARSKANLIYFKRRIYQDGTYDEDFKRNDSSIRAGFDTLYLSLQQKKRSEFLTENERSDFSFVIKNFRILLSEKPSILSSRFEEWAKRTERSLSFYEELLSQKIEGKKISTISTIMEERALALKNLKTFVLKKEAEVYEYWSKKSDLFQSLYVLETILYAEVGRLDAPDALERRDVAQVVINRFSNSLYNQLNSKDAISDFLPEWLETKKNPWLNVLFKEGEFSFTYFYIPGNFHLYCPDASKVGLFLRRENTRIALSLLNKTGNSFGGVRYFSRMSMYGRIEMDSLWKDYKAIGERPGKPVKNPRKLSELFKAEHYRYLYDFTSDDKKTYIVVEMKGIPYVVNPKNPRQIFYYRNPHQFRYFAPIKKKE